MEWFNLSDNINLLSLLGALVIVVLTLAVAGKYFRAMQTAKQNDAELSEHEWDGIGEYKNDIPAGWAVAFVLTLVWAIWYFLMGYPLNSYSQIGEYNDEVRAYNETFKAKHQNLDTKTLTDMGSGIFLVQCSACHGVTGDGINGKAANLNIWGSEEGMVDAIVNGSKGLEYPMGEMPAGLLDADSAKAVAAYIFKELTPVKTTKNENLVSTGKELFGACAACHGEDGKGMEGMSPDLTKYGSVEFIIDVLNRGKVGNIGAMPKFDTSRLNEVQQRAVAHYLTTLTEAK